VDIVNSAINYLKDFAATSEANYHVNPWIFGILFFGSAIPLYYGYYRIGKSALKFENRKLVGKKINTTELRLGITISIIAWWIPYVYVIIFGKLPWNLWLIFIAFVLIMGGLFVNALLGKISKIKKETSE